jgi:hypothetical protein
MLSSVRLTAMPMVTLRIVRVKPQGICVHEIKQRGTFFTSRKSFPFRNSEERAYDRCSLSGLSAEPPLTTPSSFIQNSKFRYSQLLSPRKARFLAAY